MYFQQKSSLHKTSFFVGLECQNGYKHQETFDIICRHVPLKFQDSEEIKSKVPVEMCSHAGVYGTLQQCAPLHSPISKQRI